MHEFKGSLKTRGIETNLGRVDINFGIEGINRDIRRTFKESIRKRIDSWNN